MLSGTGCDFGDDDGDDDEEKEEPCGDRQESSSPSPLWAALGVSQTQGVILGTMMIRRRRRSHVVMDRKQISISSLGSSRRVTGTGCGFGDDEEEESCGDGQKADLNLLPGHLQELSG
ncbi:hypothetical protein HGM15179_008357 [Zosterops borbonicus]|uniref:Uncharacterized protein n=1 Tax=Zosterops borbonicus TaxID=364589 RepID=A0A8K1GJ85_9PASS|nr:hypothetical protein HGM15179_008357 [Zosterops borbonicus]